MSEEKRIIIDKFCKRFLDVEEKPESFSKILDLSPKALKDCTEEDVNKLKEVKRKEDEELEGKEILMKKGRAKVLKTFTVTLLNFLSIKKTRTLPLSI